MKWCYTCNSKQSNDALFCLNCGSSFEVRFCPRLHQNPATAQYCGFCGSPDLSRPHKRPRKYRILAIAAVALLTVCASILLVYILVSLGWYFIIAPPRTMLT